MAEVGVKELRDSLSAWLSRVREGEEVVVTDRGQPVARLVPTGRTPLEQLVDAGLARPARARRRAAPEPLPSSGPLSDLVAEQRG